MEVSMLCVLQSFRGKGMTIAEARAHFRERLELVENEKTMIIMGLRNREFWAMHTQGAEDAVANLGYLEYDFKRILHNIDIYESQQEKLNEQTTWVDNRVEKE
jgi:hypothetical protein